MITSLHHIIQTSFIQMEDRLWHSLTDIEKRVAAVAAVIFALLLTSYVILKCYRESKETEDDDSSAINTSNPIKTQQRSLTPEEQEASKIPTISGYGFIQREEQICKRLFEMIYAKHFFDPITEPHVDEIIDQFAKLIQSGTYENKVRVELYDDQKGPAECHQNGCHFRVYTYHGGFSSTTYREISMDISFLKSFDRLSDGDNIQPPLKKMLMKVVDEMDAALKAEAKRKTEKTTT